MLLSQIQKGQKARIVKVLPSAFTDKLMEMGCIPGANIAIMMKAPLGDPIAYDLEGYCLSMRNKEARMIEVEVLEN